MDDGRCTRRAPRLNVLFARAWGRGLAGRWRCYITRCTCSESGLVSTGRVLNSGVVKSSEVPMRKAPDRLGM
eukprot:603953-Prorocentrum_minimum.AAC.1